jgi:hypothetical protein
MELLTDHQLQNYESLKYNLAAEIMTWKENSSESAPSMQLTVSTKLKSYSGSQR